MLKIKNPTNSQVFESWGLLEISYCHVRTQCGVYFLSMERESCRTTKRSLKLNGVKC